MPEHPGEAGRASPDMMRAFDCYYFEQFDPEAEANNPLNPRRVLTSGVDGLLAMVAEGATYDALCGRYGEVFVRQVMDCGVIRREGETVRFDAPVFLREDAPVLSAAFVKEAEHLADRLATIWPRLTGLVDELRNGFDAATNLYHLLCGMTLDGAFFDALCDAGVAATSRMRPSGLDYLVVSYERCEELDGLSRRLLCSWNRAIGETCVLQSFGDADGDRFDVYRWERLREAGKAQGNMPDRERLTRAARQLAETGSCEQDCLQALTAFGYGKDGRIAVPVYRPEDEPIIDAVADAVADCLLEDVAMILRRGVPGVTPEKHGVSPGETANELYHILFGRLNESLVNRGLVAQPPYRPGEGRYLQSILLT